MANEKKIGGFAIPGNLTLEEAVSRPVDEVVAHLASFPSSPEIDPVEQFCHDQGLTSALADAVIFITSDKTDAETNIRLAIHKLKRHQKLNGWEVTA